MKNGAPEDKFKAVHVTIARERKWDGPGVQVRLVEHQIMSVETLTNTLCKMLVSELREGSLAGGKKVV